MAKKGISSQHIANAFPLWADIRKDEQSLGRQFLNVVGNQMDDMREQLQKVGDNLYLTTSCISDIDVYYYARLPESFEFEKSDGDNTEWIFTPPTVSGVVGSGKYSVVLAEKNSIESFWYDSLPDRISCEETSTAATLLASGIIQHSPIPLIITSGLLDVPNHVYVTVSGNGAYLYTDDYNTSYETVIQVEGQARAGNKLTEELYFIHADTLRTINEFQQVDEVRCYHTAYNGDATIRVNSAGFNMTDHPAAYQMLRNEYKENVLMYWGIGDGYLAGQKTLDVRKYDADEILNRLGGYTDRHSFISFELINGNGSYIQALDCAVEPHSDRVWVVDSGTLYAFSSDLYYPSTTTMALRTYDAAAVIEASSYYIIPGETVTLFYIWKRPVSELVAYRIWVIKPDGTKKSIVDGSEETYIVGNGSWQPGPIVTSRNIQSADEFTLTVAGDYTYCLEVKYADESTSLDKKIICVQSKTALVELDLIAATGSATPITGIDIDSEYKIWVRNNDGTRFQIELHYDNMMIDWKRKVLYFREPYDQVRISHYS